MMAIPVTPLTKPWHPAQRGFSLVEVLVAAVLLVTGVTIATSLFTNANQMFNRSRTTDADQLAVNADLVEIQKRNRRFVCAQGTCDLFSNSQDPNEDQYTPLHPEVYPPGAVFDSQMALFQGRCLQPSGSPSVLLSEFQAKALNSLPTMGNGISRSIDITSAAAETPATPHTYSVTYTKGLQVLRRVRLVPTVAGWCP